MKKLHLFFLLPILLVTSPAISQLSFKAGNTFSRTYFKTVDGSYDHNKIRIGNSIGLSYEHWFGENLSLDFATLFVQKGYGGKNFSLAAGPIHNFEGLSLIYWQVPVTLNYYLGKEPLRFFAGTGPVLNYGIYGKFVAFLSGKDPLKDSDPYLIDVQFDGENADFTGVPTHLEPLDFGIKVRFGLSIKKTIIALEYEQGLTNYSAAKVDAFNNKVNLKNSTIYLTFGHRFIKE